MLSKSDDEAEAVRKWVIEHGGQVKSDAVELCGDADYGRTHRFVRAKRSVEQPEVLAEVPKRLLLSPRNSELKHSLSSLSPHAAAICALVHELAHPDRSFWRPYLRTLPPYGETSLPMFWSSRDANQLLAGTELLDVLREDANDHDSLLQSLKQVLPSSDNLTLKSLKSSISLVSSRAFFVPDEHSECLVPIADLFNNAVEGESVHIEGAGDEGDENEEDLEEAEEDNSDDQDGHHEGDYRKPANDDNMQDKTNVDPEHHRVIHVYTSHESNDGDDEEDHDREGEEAHVYGDTSCDHVGGCSGCQTQSQEKRDVLTITCVRSVKAGSELFNTFGVQGNAALLHKYGYCEIGPAMQHTLVNIEIELVARCLECEVSRLRASAKRFGFADDDTHWQISPDGDIESSLPAAVYLSLLSDDDAEEWLKRMLMEEVPCIHVTELVTPNSTVCKVLKAVMRARLDLYSCKTSSQEELALARSDHHSSERSSAGTGFFGEGAACILRGSEKRALENALMWLDAIDDDRDMRSAKLPKRG